MKDIKDSLKELLSSIEDLITEAEDSDQIPDEDSKANVIESLEDAQSYVADAIFSL